MTSLALVQSGSPDPVAMILAMSDPDLTDFLSTHLGTDEPDELWEALLSPDSVIRVQDLLIAIQSDVNRQLQTRKAELATARLESQASGEVLPEFLDLKAEYDDWRRRATGFRDMVSRRVRQAQAASRAAKRDRHRAHQASMTDEYKNAAAELTKAIWRHRQACLDADLKPEPHDVKLWEVLDVLTVERGQGRLSLAELVEYGFWTVEEQHR